MRCEFADNIVRGHGSMDILAARATVPPDIPRSFSALLSPLFDRSTRQTLVVAVVPFPNVFRDLYLGVGTDIQLLHLLLVLPWQPVPTADVQEFEGSLGTFPRRHVSGVSR